MVHQSSDTTILLVPDARCTMVLQGSRETNPIDNVDVVAALLQLTAKVAKENLRR
jgi:hypothetical protein